jgi:serine/threonine protein kinase
LDETFEKLQAALVDRYRFERALGSGGMATVYLARDLKHDRPVAIKVLRSELSAILAGSDAGESQRDAVGRRAMQTRVRSKVSLDYGAYVQTV